MPLVSVLVPCYNVEKYVSQCIDSIRSQTLEDIEIICINDGSTDGTTLILREYARLDSRIHIIEKQNSGYGDSMNKGLSLAQGKYVGIVESDDFIEPEMFQILYETAEREKTQITRSCYFQYKAGVDTPVTNDCVPKNRVHNPNKEHAAFWQAPAIWCSIYERDWLNLNKICFLPTPGASYQDTSFAFKCYACCERFIMLDKPLLHYRTDNENSSINNPGKVFCVCDEWDEIYRFVRSDEKRFGHLFPLMPVLQYGTYKWNYDRLEKKLKNRFIRTWARELFNHFIRGEMHIFEMDRETRTKIFRVISRCVYAKGGK